MLRLVSLFCFSSGILAACPTVAYWGGTGTALDSVVTSAGGYADAIFTVPTVATGCSWSVSFSGNFITFQGATSGTITGTTFPFSYVVPANTGSTPQQGDLVVTIDGTVAFSLTIIQNPASCVFTVSPPSVNVPPTGGSGSFLLTSTPPGCGPWSSNTGPSGLVLSPAAPQAVSWSVTANTGAARQWVITESYAPGVPSNATFTINQAAVGTTGGLAVNCNPSSVPLDLNAYSVDPYSTTCTATGGVPPYTFAQGPGTLPQGLTFQTSGGTATIQGVSIIPGTYQYSVKAMDSASNTVTYLFSGTQPPAQLLVTFPSAPPATEASFGNSGGVQGGTRPYSWSVIAGALPAGVTLTSSGTTMSISGIIATPESYSYTLQVSDSGTPPMTKTQAYSGTIAVDPLTIFPPAPLPGGRVNQGYGVNLSASGGTPPYSWSVTGTLPPGVSLTNTAQPFASLYGDPTTEGSYSFTIGLSDSGTPRLSIAQSDTVVITQGMRTSCAPPVNAAVGGAFSLTCTIVSNEVPPFYWDLLSGSPPAGVIFPVGQTGTQLTITGTPTAAGPFQMMIVAGKNLPSGEHSAQSIGVATRI